MKALLVIESCNPEFSSVPLVGYYFYEQTSKFCDVTLVTHCRNREALEKIRGEREIIYITPGAFENFYYRAIVKLSTLRGQVIWPLRHALQFPIYHFFDKAVVSLFRHRIKNREFDIVHAMTPMMPRYPYNISKYCNDIPFLMGPVNGGVPFPDAFKKTGRKEFSALYFLRSIGRWLIPGYHATYKRADLILSGSTYTKDWIEKNLRVSKTKLALMYENGVPDNFYRPQQEVNGEREASQNDIRLLFVGRLEPYKGCDMLLEAIHKIVQESSNRHRLQLTIVGDGSQRTELQQTSKKLALDDIVTFTGNIPHQEVAEHLSQSDLFCFPSIREFGGAVVMEAMACGTPCIVVDNGGIGEYVTEKDGIKIAPLGRKHVIDSLAKAITHLRDDPEARHRLAEQARMRANEFSWSVKGKELSQIYSVLVAHKSGVEQVDPVS
ncbi:glycosyltransferase family 4 protein [Microbulbifer aggregans]|uniref:glycosyltransferase family 4 protein n=1 Tax=Microbulbifer aggregans TaxID=1769779 RepID=UPI001CFD8C1C|nr:glycosyltransferase family 4 protein [Microbulbifer aggregans]